MSFSNKDLYEWTISDVCNWMHNKNLTKYIEAFQKNGITGYDLCFITNEDLKNELGIGNLHERLSLLKEFKKLVLDNLKLNIVYENSCFQISMDFDMTFTLGGLIPYIGNILRISKDISSTLVLMDTCNKEILSPNCKIIELMLLYPNKYKTLNVTTNFSRSYYREGITSNNPKSNFSQSAYELNYTTTTEGNAPKGDNTTDYLHEFKEQNSSKYDNSAKSYSNYYSKDYANYDKFKGKDQFSVRETDVRKPPMNANYTHDSLMNKNMCSSKSAYPELEGMRNEGMQYGTGISSEKNISGVQNNYKDQVTSLYHKYPSSANIYNRNTDPLEATKNLSCQYEEKEKFQSQKRIYRDENLNRNARPKSNEGIYNPLSDNQNCVQSAQYPSTYEFRDIKTQYNPSSSPGNNFAQRSSNENTRSVERSKGQMNRKNSNDSNNNSMTKNHVSAFIKNPRKFHEDNIDSDRIPVASYKNIRVNTPLTSKGKFETDSSYKRQGK